MCLQTKATLSKAIFPLLCTGALLGTLPASAGEPAFIWHPDDRELQWGPCPEFMPEGCGLAVLQGDPADHNADVFFRLPGGTTAPHHWHTSAERMVLVSGTMEVDYDGQEPVTLKPGTYAYGPPKLPHVTHCRSEEDCLLFIAFEKPVDAIGTE
ncbi:cupin domain-containing protein [Marinimicrobium alkaliphilum]|uniref:cupin domain-containing protein n=1 Tax=Marinimicrobium alkaliphilum TaxID=2202654 RepID=UPI000DBA8E21|nr:cupin domain-containing protein [Marinimicrobium alkaliphilum]